VLVDPCEKKKKCSKQVIGLVLVCLPSIMTDKRTNLGKHVRHENNVNGPVETGRTVKRVKMMVESKTASHVIFETETGFADLARSTPGTTNQNRIAAVGDNRAVLSNARSTEIVVVDTTTGAKVGTWGKEHMLAGPQVFTMNDNDHVLVVDTRIEEKTGASNATFYMLHVASLAVVATHVWTECMVEYVVVCKGASTTTTTLLVFEHLDDCV
jgi:hypothetical protein